MDIRLKDFPAQRQINVSMSISGNRAATGKDLLIAPLRSGAWLANAATARRLPAVRTSPTYTDVLPSLSLNYRLSERQSIRPGLTRTLSRPEYRKLTNVQYREVLGGDNVIGNPDLRRALIHNADLRWELYPSPTGALSIGLFAKIFQDPIERVCLATFGTRIVTFANAEGAQNYGVDLEARKGLGALAGSLATFTVFTNVTLMKSDIQIGSGVTSRINDERPMVGQSPHGVNAGLTYATAHAGTSATVLFNMVGRRVSSAAEAPLPDVYEEARQALALSLRFSFSESTSAKLNLKNLLDSPYELRQGPVVREYYRTRTRSLLRPLLEALIGAALPAAIGR